MSLWQACVLTLLRSVCIVALAMPVCLLLRGFLCHCQQRKLAWTLLLIPVVAPRMVTGYGYANFELSLLPYPFWNELLYDFLLWTTVIPIGTVFLYFTPAAPVSAAALHCDRLCAEARTNSWRRRAQRFSMLARSEWAQMVPASCVMFVCTFQEFELASIMSVTAWTVWLFDAQAGGLILSESLQLAIAPVLCELTVLGLGLWIVNNNRGLIAPPHERPSPLPRRFATWIAWACLGGSTVCLIIPWAFVMRASVPGFKSVATNFTLGRDIVSGCLFASLAAATAYMTAWWISRFQLARHNDPARSGVASRTFVDKSTSSSLERVARNERGAAPPSPGMRARLSQRTSEVTGQARQENFKSTLSAWPYTFALPGLFGTLILALTTLATFQLPVFQTVYGTPLPWLLALILYLLPRALVVVLLFGVIRPRESGHLVAMQLQSARPLQKQQARELRWQTSGSFHLLTFSFLFYWAYVDLTSASILAPPSLVSAPVRLYNLMHYGQSAVLSAMVLISFGSPLAIFATVWLCRRPLQKAWSE